jgi:RND family efflux transporter MFP subunit
MLPVLILALGIASFAALRATRPEAAQNPTTHGRAPVWVVHAEPRTHPVTVRAMGLVQPAREVMLQPEVGGRVLSRSDNLVPGGLVQAGEVLVRLDSRDQRNILEAQRAALAAAKVRLEEERTLKQVAEREWRTDAEKLAEDAREFALREPHVRSAAAGISSAQSQLKKARRDIRRTMLEAPFDAIVREAPIEVGEVVSPLSVVASLAAIDEYWVRVSVPVAQLSHLDIPGVNTSESRGSKARIVHDAGAGVRIERTGAIERLLSSVDSQGRMAQLLVVVDDPLGLAQDTDERRLPLLLGTYVHVELRGRPAEDSVALPRAALHPNETVWTVAEGDVLAEQPVTLIARERDGVLVRGLAPGTPVVVTRLSSPTQGMEVSIAGEGTAPPERAQSGQAASQQAASPPAADPRQDREPRADSQGT